MESFLPCNIDLSGLTEQLQKKVLSVWHRGNICQLSQDFDTFHSFMCMQSSKKTEDAKLLEESL